jgi:ankyrin repeat protein
LLLAAIYGHIDAAKALISFGTSIHHLDDMNWNALMHACYHNHTAMCTYLVSIGADYLHASTDQWTALSLAVFRGCKEIALYLLTFPQLQECVTHLYSPNGYNILQLALFGKHYELAQELVHGGYIYIDSYSRSGLTALMYQAQLGDVESIDLLLTLSADINKKSEAGTTALMVAIASEQQDCASTLLSRGANPMDKDQAGNTSLVLAAKHSSSDSNMPLVEHILSAMPLDKVSPPEAQQVFMLAAVNGNPQLAQVLLTHGVDPNHQDAQGNTALLLAVDHGNTVIVTSLVQQPHVDATIKNAQGESALLLACRKGHIELCTSLLAVSADCINDSDDTGAFPLLHWTAHASLPMIKQLVKHGANVNQQTKDGTSALMLAVDAKQHRITKWLLKQGVDANLVTHDGYTSLMIAVANKDAVSTNLLLNMGANVDLYTTTGSSALMSACIHGNLDILRAILARHADIDHQHDTNDYTALHYAVESGSLSAILSLLGHGADATLQTRDKSTPLLLALTKSRSDIALVLVSYQPSVIHVPDIHGNTPLLIATKHNLVHVVQKLCAYGADTNIANHHDETPLLAACHSHNSDLVTCLVSYHASVHFDHIQACLGHNDDSFTRLLLYTGGLRLGLGLDNHDPFDMLDDCFKASETKLQSLLRTIQQEQVYVTQVMDVTYRMDILLSMIGHVQREEYEIRSYLVTQFYVVVVTLETLIQTRKDALVQQVDELLYVMVEHLDRVEEVLQQQQ